MNTADINSVVQVSWSTSAHFYVGLVLREEFMIFLGRIANSSFLNFLCPFKIPPITYRSSHYFIALSALGIVGLFNFSHSSGGISYCHCRFT